MVKNFTTLGFKGCPVDSFIRIEKIWHSYCVGYPLISWIEPAFENLVESHAKLPPPAKILTPHVTKRSQNWRTMASLEVNHVTSRGRLSVKGLTMTQYVTR